MISRRTVAARRIFANLPASSATDSPGLGGLSYRSTDTSAEHVKIIQAMAQAFLSLSQNSILHLPRYSLDARLDQRILWRKTAAYPPIMTWTGQVVENATMADRPNSRNSATFKVSSSAQTHHFQSKAHSVDLSGRTAGCTIEQYHAGSRDNDPQRLEFTTTKS